MGLTDLWGQLVDCICRPPRDIYTIEDLIGGERCVFKITRFKGRREDITLVNKKGQKLQCSHFIPVDAKGKSGKLPCVLYCHCNSGSRRDAEEAVYVLLPLGVSVFTLDFAGSGLSDGSYVTLGANEVDDVEVAVNHLRASGQISTLGLWGRSMGAVTALLYSQRDPSIAGIVRAVVVDSPFSKLTDLISEIVEEQKLPIPKPFFKMALSVMKRSVRKKAGFELDKVSPLDVVPQSFTPCLFGHATGDSFIKIAHSEKLFAAYAGDKNLIRFEGDHNSRRPEFFYSSVSFFFHTTLQLDVTLEGGNQLEREVRNIIEGQTLPHGLLSVPRVVDASLDEGPGGAAAHSFTAMEHSGATRYNLDAWGDRARADLQRVMTGHGEAVENAQVPDDEEDAALMAAIQLSLLEAASGGGPHQEDARNSRPEGSSSGAISPQGETPSAGGGGPSDALTEPIGQHPRLSNRGSYVVQNREQRDSGPPQFAMGGLLDALPTSEEDEEAMLAAAIQASLSEGKQVEGNVSEISLEQQSGQRLFPLDTPSPPGPTRVSTAGPSQLEGPSVAGNEGHPLASPQTYVDQLCDELGGFFSEGGSSTGEGLAPPEAQDQNQASRSHPT